MKSLQEINSKKDLLVEENKRYKKKMNNSSHVPIRERYEKEIELNNFRITLIDWILTPNSGTLKKE